MYAQQSDDPLCACGHHVRLHAYFAGCSRCLCQPNSATHESEHAMSRNGTTTHVHHLPDCDLHKYALNQPGVPAKYDKRTNTGQWGYVCEDHFKSDTDGRLGTGHGQELIVGEPPAVDKQTQVRRALINGNTDELWDLVGDGDLADYL